MEWSEKGFYQYLIDNGFNDNGARQTIRHINEFREDEIDRYWRKKYRDHCRAMEKKAEVEA